MIIRIIDWSTEEVEEDYDIEVESPAPYSGLSAWIPAVNTPGFFGLNRDQYPLFNDVMQQMAANKSTNKIIK